MLEAEAKAESEAENKILASRPSCLEDITSQQKGTPYTYS